jgi:hypothetical protein
MDTNNNKFCLPRQSRLVSLSDAVSCVIVVLLGGCLYFLSSYEKSLFIDKTAAMWNGLFGLGYVLCSILSVLISVILIVRVTISFGKVTGFWGGIRGLLVVLVTLGFFMPTLGKSHTPIYRRKANSVATTALHQFNDSQQAKEFGGSFQLDDYSIESRWGYNQNSHLIEFQYELNRKIETDSFPQRFSVILNMENGSAELRKETSPKR